MSVMFSNELINDIKRANPIADVMMEYGKKITPEFKTFCDFHKDSSPSMHIYIFPDAVQDSYHCFVCEAGRKGQELILPDGEKIVDAGSDVIAWIQNRERCNWHEAIRILAGRANITLPEEKKDPVAEQMKQDVTTANRKFYQTLQGDAEALKYLADRGIFAHDIAKWRLGMVPWDWADKRYAGRIVFGIAEVNYQSDKALTIAMAYRSRQLADYEQHGFDMSTKELVDKTMRAKYYNDATSRIYEKKQVIYGLNEAIKAIRKYRHVVIMEGYTDVILAHKNGLETAVAACGTAITEEQVEILSHYTRKAFIWLDGDKAGESAMIRSLPIFLKYGFDVQIVKSPMGMDPAELVQSGETLINYIKNHATPGPQVIIDMVVAKYDILMNKARIEALEDLLPLINAIERPADKANYQAVVENKLNVRL
jgi:DNA primase